MNHYVNKLIKNLYGNACLYGTSQFMLLLLLTSTSPRRRSLDKDLIALCCTTAWNLHPMSTALSMSSVHLTGGMLILGSAAQQAN